MFIFSSNQTSTTTTPSTSIRQHCTMFVPNCRTTIHLHYAPSAAMTTCTKSETHQTLNRTSPPPQPCSFNHDGACRKISNQNHDSPLRTLIMSSFSLNSKSAS
ncbi:hypothetical protein V8G54_004775 [Vigna mungo]|uniref:Uncharacterized protein n=1 Tax=Vigna mungo TaxID=3915 RepID=A0AAQ3PCC0_VIGMU